MTEATQELRAHGKLFGKEFDTDKMNAVQKHAFLAMAWLMTFGVWAVGAGAIIAAIIKLVFAI